MRAQKKILFICSRDADYLQDAVYSGLIEVLGPENVFEVPFNRFFHHEFRPYPRNLGFQRGSLWPRVRMFWQDFKFELVIVGSAKPDAFAAYQAWQKKIPSSVPVVFLDGGDRPELGGDLAREGRPELYGEITRARPFDLIFKREYLLSETHPQNVHPLPFAIPAQLLPLAVEREKKYDVTFWAVESDPIRTQALKVLQDQFDCRSNGTTLSQQFKRYKRKGKFYLEELTRAKVTLNFRGVGWDTLRYWEVPALSQFLVSQRPQIHIPDNFREGKEIVYCKDDLSDLIEICEFYLKNETARENIAKAAGRWSQDFHTPRKRVESILQKVRF